MKNDPSTQHWLPSAKGPYKRPWPNQSREDALADWLGAERTPDVMASLREEPRSMEQLVQEVMASVNKEDMLLLSHLQNNWTELVGPDNARALQPLSINNGVLKLEAASASWLYIFQTQLKKPLLDKCRAAVGDAIRDLQFVPAGQRRPQPPTPFHQNRHR